MNDPQGQATYLSVIDTSLGECSRARLCASAPPLIPESAITVASGNRNNASGAFNNVGSNGYNWSSSVTGTNGYNLNFNATNVNPANNNNRANGFPIRCIQAFTPKRLFLTVLWL